MNKKRRQELKQLKYVNRIKRFLASWGTYINREGEYIRNPKTKDIIQDNGMLYYKNTSTPCSCGMCAYYKYKRHEQKIMDDKLIQDGLEDFYNPE